MVADAPGRRYPRPAPNAAVDALRLIDAAGKGAAIDAPEDAAVLALCEFYGFGAVMEAAARLWFRRDPTGALTVGPCAATVRAALSEFT